MPDYNNPVVRNYKYLVVGKAQSLESKYYTTLNCFAGLSSSLLTLSSVDGWATK